MRFFWDLKHYLRDIVGGRWLFPNPSAKYKMFEFPPPSFCLQSNFLAPHRQGLVSVIGLQHVITLQLREMVGNVPDLFGDVRVRSEIEPHSLAFPNHTNHSYQTTKMSLVSPSVPASNISFASCKVTGFGFNSLKQHAPQMFFLPVLPLE